MLYEDVRKEGIALKSGKMKMKKEKEKSEEAAETRGCFPRWGLASVGVV